MAGGLVNEVGFLGAGYNFTAIPVSRRRRRIRLTRLLASRTALVATARIRSHPPDMSRGAGNEPATHGHVHRFFSQLPGDEMIAAQPHHLLDAVDHFEIALAAGVGDQPYGPNWNRRRSPPAA